MGVVSFLNSFNTKRRSTAVFAENSLQVGRALDLVFRTIALEKNQMLYPVPAHAMSRKEHQAIVLDAAKKLTASLRNFVVNQNHTALPIDFLNAIQTLDSAIAAYQADEHTLPQLLLACSSIKIGLEKNS